MTPSQFLLITIMTAQLQLSMSFTSLVFAPRMHFVDKHRTNSRLFLTQEEYDNNNKKMTNNDSPSNHLSDATSSTSINFAMDPHTDEAKSVTGRLGLSPNQHETLVQLAELIVTWNDRINVVSRRDCTLEVVFGRHILPSLAMLKILTATITQDQTEGGTSGTRRKVIDVGTGGGFPGLPLAIALPDVDFVLVDSVGKKLIVVQEMATALSLDNVSTHHGRAEEMADDLMIGRTHRRAYDVCVGRSVTSIPRFCFWMQDLLQEQRGKLFYIIGGELDDAILQRTEADVAIDELLQQDGASDKRILVFPQAQVKAIAKTSGEVKQFRGSRRGLPNPVKGQKTAKGAWSKRSNTGEPKQRGMENFKRYGY